MLHANPQCCCLPPLVTGHLVLHVTWRRHCRGWVDSGRAGFFAPGALLETDIRIYWPADGNYYSGRVVAYDQATFKHKVGPGRC